MDETLYGDYIFLNTGSVSNIPNIKGIHEARHIYTSAEMMKERSLPAKLAIIGGGYIGLEFSSMYARYGSTVTVFEHGSRLVKREDQDVNDSRKNQETAKANLPPDPLDTFRSAVQRSPAHNLKF